MEHDSYLHFLQQSREAQEAGFAEQFQIFPCGSLLCLSSRQVYVFEDLADASLKESCDLCRTSLLYVTAIDGKKGTVLEHWEHS